MVLSKFRINNYCLICVTPPSPTIIKLINKHLEETNSPQKPLLETYSYPDLKKVLSLYNIQPITDDKNENKNI